MHLTGENCQLNVPLISDQLFECQHRASPDVSQTTTFADLVLSLHGPAYSRDEIQPIYRPLVSDTVELLPVRRRPSNAPPAVRRQSSSGAAVARVSVDVKIESAPVEAERPQIIIEGSYLVR